MSEGLSNKQEVKNERVLEAVPEYVGYEGVTMIDVVPKGYKVVETNSGFSGLAPSQDQEPHPENEKGLILEYKGIKGMVVGYSDQGYSVIAVPEKFVKN